jgi:predicted ATPase
VLVSEASYVQLDGTSALTELGRHRLKDLTEPQPLYQLGDDEFPPLKTLYQTNLPVQPTPLVGREEELAEVLALISKARLVTLTGAGGSGKTRLALQAAAELVDDYPQGVWWVSLAVLRDPELVESTIAQAVGARDGLGDHLREQKTLLLVDNFEHLLSAAPRIAALLAEAPKLRVLATSRERLALAAEHEYQVPTLVPGEAIALLTARARQLKPGFEPDEHVEEICRRLDGLPLAIELAAARVKVLRPEQILERLATSLELLTASARDAPERQRTLRATIEWSYHLLDASEKELFARLAVFAGSFELEAAEAVCEAEPDTLASLVDKSLLRQTEEGRFFMLETLREFALERLEETSARSELRKRHAQHYLALAERAEPELRGPGQQGWLDRLEGDHDNLRAVLAWSREVGDTQLGLRLASALWRFWRTHNHLAEGSRVIEAILELGEAAPASLAAQALRGASRLAMDEGDVARSVARAEEALVAARTSGEAREVAAATENLGLMKILTGAMSEAFAPLEESIALYRAIGDSVGTADALNNLANALLVCGETARAAEVGDEALALQRNTDNALGTAFVLHTLGYIALYAGDLELAGGRLSECLALYHELGDLSRVGDSLEGLAHVAAGRGNDSRAAVLWAAGESIRAEAGKQMEPPEAALHDDALTLVRSRLGETAFARAWAEGAALVSEEAVAYALADGDRRFDESASID